MFRTEFGRTRGSCSEGERLGNLEIFSRCKHREEKPYFQKFLLLKVWFSLRCLQRGNISRLLMCSMYHDAQMSSMRKFCQPEIVPCKTVARFFS